MEDTSFQEEMRAIKAAVKEMRQDTEDEWFLSRLIFVSNSLDNLQALYQEMLKIHGAAALDEKEEFRLLVARLAGLSEQFTALGRKRPESACGTFKAQQVNRVLAPLKELIEKDMGPAISLVSEEGEQSYSDVSLLLQCCMNLCASFALQHYDLEYDIRGREIPSGGLSYGYGHR